MLEEYVDGDLTVSYVYGRDLISQERSSVTSFYLVDGLGSTTALTDANGNVTDTYSYEAFGELEGRSGSTENSYQFAGEQFDENLGDYYLRQRYYDTETGRFTRKDSFEGWITRPDSLHKYVYAHNNPITLTDPSGLTPFSDFTRLYRRVGLLSFLHPIYAAAQLGGIIHRAIQADIQQDMPNAQIEVPVVGGRIDVLLPPNEIYKIKPLDGVVNPHIQLDRYINSNPARNLIKGTYIFDGRVDDPAPAIGISLRYYTDEPGVILYWPFVNERGTAAIVGTLFAVIAASSQKKIGEAVTSFVSHLTLTKGLI